MVENRPRVSELLESLQPEARLTESGEVEYVGYGEGPVIMTLHGAMGGYDQSVILAQTVLDDPETRDLYCALIASTFNQMAKRIPGTDNDIRTTREKEYPLEEIKVPVLIVHGQRDPLVSFDRHAKSLASRIPRARLVALQEGEHAAIFTHRQLVRREIRQFLEAC